MLHLSLLEGVGPVTIQSLITRASLHTDWDAYLMWSAADWAAQFALTSALAHKIATGLTQHALEKELELIARAGALWTTIMSADYPALLAQIHAPPAVLYWRGTLPSSAQSIAVVGSRAASGYGQRVVEQLIAPLAQAGWTIVSGGALGIDTMAHKVALDAGGTTLVVLGSGLLRSYPSQNRALFDRVVHEGGAVVSCFAMHTAPLAGNFPARNRIIAGMSKGCIVIQAAQRSGANITARFALEQGREVCTVPGAFDDPLSDGCHDLIRDGATLVTQVSHIYEAFGQQYAISDATLNQTVSTAGDVQIAPEALLNDHAKVVRACTQPRALDELIELTELSREQLQEIIFACQLQGLIEQDFTGLWRVAR